MSLTLGRLRARRVALALFLVALLLMTTAALPAAAATPTPGPTPTPGAGGAAPSPGATASPTARPAGPPPLPAGPPLGQGSERFLLVNQHGGLFYESDADLRENAAYAAWLGASAIRVFATDAITYKPWDGRRVGRQIARWAPHLRTHRLKLVVALVNNHRPVPGEASESAGWLDGFFQLQLPFYWGQWKGPYLRFADDLITTVRQEGATDVIAAWELGNELHTPQAPAVFPEFLRAAVTEVRKVDAATPIWPGTMGGHHLEPWVVRSPVARWLYCEAPVDAYTLHAYDWLSGDVPGDMPVHWDLDGIVAEPCPNGRRIPVVVEELGTSRALPGWYGSEDEEARLLLELHQLRFVLGYPAVRGVGVWNGISPRVTERTYDDHRRGLTSYGPDGRGGGSCYPQYAEPKAAGAVSASAAPLPVRCRLEQLLHQLPTGF
ncbi:MAG TPA: hypothetical protein VHS99_02545 [Chloroflexota bacterium]|jgi:hypothetical protein|nr:hypothetical protein [Chloroflexota bacterium]